MRMREYAQGRQALPRPGDMRAAPVVWPRAASPGRGDRARAAERTSDDGVSDRLAYCRVMQLEIVSAFDHSPWIERGIQLRRRALRLIGTSIPPLRVSCVSDRLAYCRVMQLEIVSAHCAATAAAQQDNWGRPPITRPGSS